MNTSLKKIVIGVFMVSAFSSTGVLAKVDENTECGKSSNHHCKKWDWGFNWTKVSNNGKHKWNSWFGSEVTEVKLLEESIVLDEEVELKEIENLDIRSERGEVIFKVGKTETLGVELKHNIEKEYAPELEVVESESGIEILNKSNMPKSYRYDGEASVILEITLPKKFEKNIHVDSVAGTIINEEALKLNEFKVKLLAGSIKFEKLNVQNLEVQCSAGRIDISELESKDTDISLTSGAIDVQIDSIAGDINLNVTSGKLDVDIPKKSDVDVNVDAFYFSRDISDDIEIVKDENSMFKGRLGKGKYDIDLSIAAGKIQLDVE